MASTPYFLEVIQLQILRGVVQEDLRQIREAKIVSVNLRHCFLGSARRSRAILAGGGELTRELTNKEIANHFSLSEQTVKNHLYRAKRKVGANGRLEIVEVCRPDRIPA